MASSAGRRTADLSAVGIAKMFHDSPQSRTEVMNEVNRRPPRADKYVHSHTPGNDTAAMNIEPNNNLLRSRAVYHIDIKSMVASANRDAGIKAYIIDKYLAMICDYVNRRQVPPRNLAGTMPLVAHLSKTFIMILTQPDRQQWVINAVNDLANHGYPLQVFRQLRYMFVPIVMRTHGTVTHAVLLVISPEAKTMEILDSGSKRNFRYPHYYDDWFRLMNLLYGREFIPSEWRVREVHTQSQSTTPFCALYVLCNAMCYAFGYDNMKLGDKYNDNLQLLDRPRSRRWLMRRRRWLMMRELMEGRFSTVPNTRFFYPLVDKAPTNDFKHGWKHLSPAVMRALPIEARARLRKYEHFTTKAALTRHVRQRQTSGTKYAGYTVWSELPLAEYIERVEIRDYEEKHKVAVALRRR